MARRLKNIRRCAHFTAHTCLADIASNPGSALATRLPLRVRPLDVERSLADRDLSYRNLSLNIRANL